jgi:hypothetical protein
MLREEVVRKLREYLLGKFSAFLLTPLGRNLHDQLA